MKIGILSDASSPTPTPGAHGLGKAVHAQAEGLQRRGHTVTLFAAEGSTFSGELVTPVAPNAEYWKAEVTLANAAYKAHESDPFDVLLDNTHIHALTRFFPGMPVVNFYHDKFQEWRRGAVLMSEGQRELMLKDDPRFASARVIHHQLDAADYPLSLRHDDYLLFLGVLRDYKQPILAIEAAAMVGLPLKIVGGAPFTAPVFSGNENAKYLGVIDGQPKIDLLRGAAALLQFGHLESFGLSTIEAALCGTPIVAWPSGGNLDTVRDGVNGVFVRANKLADAIHRAIHLPRLTVHEYTAAAFGCPDKQLEQIEQAAKEVIAGWAW